MTNLFIPKKIKVGFQNRQGTYTGKLAYVIYYDEKGKIRKETSWKNWCDKSIPAIEFDNTPRNNYVFNKGIRRYSDWGSGRSVIRVYDPRDFEFEISVDNLVGILMHSDVSKRDIVEECVFAWAGPELVLLPVNSQEYQDSIKYTEKQELKISAKNLIKGATYSFKKSDSKVVYLGYFEYFDVNFYNHSQESKGKKHVFYNLDSKNTETPSISILAECISDEVHNEYASFVDNFFNSWNGSAIVGFELGEYNESCKYGYIRDTNTDLQFDVKPWRIPYKFASYSISHQLLSEQIVTDGNITMFGFIINFNRRDIMGHRIITNATNDKWRNIADQYDNYLFETDTKGVIDKDKFYEFHLSTLKNAGLQSIYIVLKNGHKILYNR